MCNNRLDYRKWWFLTADGLSKPFQGICLTLDFDRHPAVIVADRSGQSEPPGQLVDEGSKANPLHNAFDDDSVPLQNDNVPLFASEDSYLNQLVVTALLTPSSLLLTDS